MPEILQLLVSSIHRYVGRPADGPSPAAPGELVASLRIGPGTRKALRGKGGVRCTPLTDGVLRVGPVEVSVS